MNRNSYRYIRKFRIKKVLKFLIQIFIIINIIAFFLFVYFLFLISDDVIDIYHRATETALGINENTFKDKSETVIYDRKGNVIDTVAAREYCYIEDIHPQIKNAVIAIEDNRYYEHNGYDLIAIARAGIALIKNKGKITQGGSTITQQLVKLQFLTLDQTFERKLEEIIIAKKLDDKFSKEQILEWYLNNINYGNGAYGIETASRKYFNKPSDELTISEIAFLTAIPNNPSYYNPLRYMENTLKRKDLILLKMYENGYIDYSTYQEAKNEKIELNMPEKKQETEKFEVSFILSSATKLLMEKQGFEFQYWFESKEEREKYWEEYNDLFVQINQRLRNGGFRIYSSIDLNKQKELQEIIDQELSNNQEINKDTGLYDLQGAAVTIDNKTGDVVAIVGGRKQKGNSFNRAFLSFRQPGSVIKPLVAYTPAFERGMKPTAIVEDKPIKNGPQNASGLYRGKIEFSEAVERSINTVPYQLVAEYGPREMLSYLEKMEFTRLEPQDNHPGIAVGGFTIGVSPLEITSAYSTLARNGEFIKPTGIYKIKDYTNNTLYKNEYRKKQIYKSESAYLMTETLKGVLTSDIGTAYGYALPNMSSAGKTGTTNDNKDSWFLGYTPYYTTGVWVGKDDPETITELHAARNIWNKYMTSIHQGLEYRDFVKPALIPNQ